jgi:protein transport protein SEC31
VSAIMQDQLTDFVAQSDPRKWKETLAVLSTYGKSDEFPALCAALGDRLEGAGSFANGSLCYMCALNLGKTVRYWRFSLQKSNGASEDGRSSTTDLLSLHDFIEKVTVFAQAMDSSHYQLEDDVASLFSDYSKALAEQGLLVSASRYLRGCETQECKELRDRIYRSRLGGFCSDLMASPPAFPFDFVNVGVARDLQGITLKKGGMQQLPAHQDFAAQTSQHLQVQQQSQYNRQSPLLQSQNAQQMPPVPPLPTQSQVRSWSSLAHFIYAILH